MDWNWVRDRLCESGSWAGIAAFCASAGASLIGAGLPRPGIVVAAIGGGCSGVAAFILKEKEPHNDG